MHRAFRFSGHYSFAGSSENLDFDTTQNRDFDAEFEAICDDWSLDEDVELEIELLG